MRETSETTRTETAPKTGGQDPAVERLRNALDALAAVLDEARLALRAFSGARPSASPGRVLRSHSADRKRVVFQFLCWCWSARGGPGFFGPVPETVAEEFALYGMWAKRICPAADRPSAAQIDSLPEYSACREGLRKMCPDKWRELQGARQALLGALPAGTPRPPSDP